MGACSRRRAPARRRLGPSPGWQDLAILPGTKATVADLAWLEGRGFAEVLVDCPTVLGICGGYQMLGRSIEDTLESGAGTVDGLRWLPVDTRFEATKITRQRRGRAWGQPVAGYQIHHGRSTTARPWVEFDDGWGAKSDGAASPDGRVLGTTLHGLFESDAFRNAFLSQVARRAGKRFTPSGVSFPQQREALFDRLADLLEAHLDMAAVDALIAGVAVRTP